MSNRNKRDTPRGIYLAELSLITIGIVFGDIGTSPLYAFRESFHAGYGLAVSETNILGILSLIFWSLILIISVKYMIFVLKADNHGEGGIIALTALLTTQNRSGSRQRLLLLLGLFGASLLYGDSMITPAISVLSAVEGLEVATPFFEPYIIPITIGILVGLFLFQSYGTAGIGKVFGPIILVWFSVMSLLGLLQIIRHPEVLTALNPLAAFEFFAHNGTTGFLVLGSVFLVVTGGEALYADIGHFGLLPIRLSWFTVVLPGLLLNYFGQGALIYSEPATVRNPFFLMAPEWALYPLVGLATAAAIIASQAVISGAFSLTRQAIQLGYAPRLNIRQTSQKEYGQIYIPFVNWTLMLACIALVAGFGSSSNLASAYGVGVTTDMVFTTVLFSVVMHRIWKWNLVKTGFFAAAFLIMDLAFWGANIIKVPEGGWFPLVIATFIFTLMTTWKRGRKILASRMKAGELPFELFLKSLAKEKLARVPGTAIFMYSNPNSTPPALLHNIKHNKVIHENIVLLGVKTDDEGPYVHENERVQVEMLTHDIYRIIIRYGFSETVNIPKALELVNEPGLDLNLMRTTFFLGKERILATKNKDMALWRDKLFAFMSRNARNATDYFGLPPDRVVEVGAQIEI